MNYIDKIRRLRWSHGDGCRLYRFSTAIMKDDKEALSLRINQSFGLSSEYYSRLTGEGRQIVEELISTKGIIALKANTFCLEIKIDPIFDFGDFHDHIVKLLQTVLFAGEDLPCDNPGYKEPMRPF